MVFDKATSVRLRDLYFIGILLTLRKPFVMWWMMLKCDDDNDDCAAVAEDNW